MKFEELNIWKTSQELYLDLHKDLEKTDQAFLKQEMLRTGLEVSQAIAQGFERFSKTDFIVFLQKAKTSLAWLKNLVHVAHKIGMLSQDRLDYFIDKCGMNAAMTQNYIKSLSTQKVAVE